MHHREHTCESETEERSRSCPQPTFRFVFSFIWGEPCRKLPTSLRTFARRCCPLCSPLLRKQKVPSCMKLWEHLFLFFLFFSLWGWGEARRGEERSAGATQSLRMSSKSAHKHEIPRGRYVSNADISFFLSFSFPSRENFSLQTLHIFADWSAADGFMSPRLSRPLRPALAGQRKPRRLVTFNPRKPCPHTVFCSACRSTSLHHPAS